MLCGFRPGGKRTLGGIRTSFASSTCGWMVRPRKEQAPEELDEQAARRAEESNRGDKIPSVDLPRRGRGMLERRILRWLTKPWDDLDLRLTLRRALEKRALERENQRLIATIRRHEVLLADLEKRYPGITRIKRDERPVQNLPTPAPCFGTSG
jgi:hypothetical protein